MPRSLVSLVRSRAFAGAAVAVALAVGVTACGGDGDTSVRAEPETTTSAPVSTPSTTAAATPSGDGQVVTYQSVQITVPKDWPVYDLAADPTRCVRADEHAVYLGRQGPTPDCPARVIGRTETVQIQPLDASSVDADRATQATTVNGINARVDPDPDTNGALTIAVTDQNLVVFVTYGDRPAADALLATLATA